ncbi:hypothetical protein BD626DRAFT_516090 [Schizophyllum amplum]|uniref:Uncharacterized protein n=1 Tax=Schizophyllum amplum TaxID=97359 RepID=A0A550BX72_9AGAR|nr:hypothetical protein BD626DRAFT_516090 [Auriculariopsis ampla]
MLAVVVRVVRLGHCSGSLARVALLDLCSFFVLSTRECTFPMYARSGPVPGVSWTNVLRLSITTPRYVVAVVVRYMGYMRGLLAVVVIWS